MLERIFENSEKYEMFAYKHTETIEYVKKYPTF